MLDESELQLVTAGGPPAVATSPAPGPARRRWWHAPAAVAALATATRVGLGLLVGRFALSVLPLRGFPLAAGNKATSGTGALFSWDAFFYQSVATSGYPKDQPAWSPFFPLYPETARAVEHLGRIGYQPAALAVSWVSLFFATWGVVRLARDLLPEGAPARAGWLLVWFPASVLLIAGYAESTFIALFAWTLVALRERHPWWAAAFASLAALTRPEGAAVGLAVVLWCLLEPRRRWLRAVVLAAASEAGFVAFTVFLWVRYGNPIEEFRAQKYWGRAATWPFHPLVGSLQHLLHRDVTGPGSANITAVYLLDDASVVAAVVGFVVLLRWARRERDLWWMLAPALVSMVGVVANGPVHGSSPESDVRYVLCLVPLYLVAARWRGERLWTAALTSSVALAVVFQVLFNLGGWFT
ncbi:glycosyltransferase 87 family protein [Acidiferrimicrobium sp. IK]|uniref:glycosyltransferase 87 family protein n=1 Tax=Acidiferrimicrobium sp. IK TaxID=2871700 RepID=UPI0021CB87D8|nr:glycosyltransferase 87 family protein [Acidiferrimicrobium sp. IK]MCU4185845.1 glycosyltransferase 87 family protein [Acidiferrimicrobium sp. IK]